MLSDFAAFQLLNNALQVADLRQQVYANNIANMDTPGYKREDVHFESALRSAMSNTSSSSLLGRQTIPLGQSQDMNDYNWSAMLAVRPVVTVSSGSVISNNGNNVDIEAEMVKLAENQIRYQALVQDLTDRISRLNTAITG